MEGNPEVGLTKNSFFLCEAGVGPPGAMSPCPFLCPPSLQLLDAHHKVEMALGVLLNDISHIIGLPCLLRDRKTHVTSPLGQVGSVLTSDSHAGRLQ